MRKRSIAEIPTVPIPVEHDVTHELTSDDIGLKWLITPELGVVDGTAARATVAPGSQHAIHRHSDVEEVMYLLDGSGTFLGGGEPIPHAAGEAVFVPRHGWHGWENTSDAPATLLVLYGGATGPDDAGFEAYETGAEPGMPVRKTSAATTVPTVWTDPRTGATATTRRLVSPDAVGAADVILALTELSPGLAQPLHRHPGAEQWLLVTAGTAALRSEDAPDVPLVAGDVVYLSAGEAHALTAGPEGCALVWGQWGEVVDLATETLEPSAG